MVDGVYQDIFEALKPGVRENEIVALANKRLYETGLRRRRGDQRRLRASAATRTRTTSPTASSGPGDQAFFDIIQSFNGYRTCYYRTFAVGSSTPSQRDAYNQAREWIDAAIDLVRPGVGTDADRPGVARGDRVRVQRRDGRVRARSSVTASGSACTNGP